MAASVPPVIMTSASSRWMVWKASPMALAAEAQAVATAVLAPHRPEVNRDVAGGRVGDHLGDDERADLAGAALMIAGVLLFELVEAADAAAEDDAAAERIFLAKVEAAVFDGFDGGDQRELGEAVEAARGLAVEILFGIQVLDFAAEVDLEGASVSNCSIVPMPLRPASKPCQ